MTREVSTDLPGRYASLYLLYSQYPLENAVWAGLRYSGEEICEYARKDLMCNHDVPTDGIDATVLLTV